MPSADEPGLRWGLIGASDIAARSIIPAIRARPASSVAGVVSRSAEWGTTYARAHGLPRRYADLAELLADAEVDAVYVSSTNDLHHDQTTAAARAGKHVLCEKPLALSLSDAADMVAACESAGVVLATNHGRRHDAGFRAARDLVRSGRLGTVQAVRTSTAILLPERLRSWRLASPAAGAGAVLDIVVHDADTVRFVLDDEPREVSAYTAENGMASGGVEDTVMGTMRLESGLLASFFCAFTTPGGSTSLEVHGREASVVTSRTPHGSTAMLRHGGGGESLPLAAFEPAGDATVAAFETAVHSGGEPTATGQDGLQSLAVALATLESARTGQPSRVPPPA